MKRQERGMKKKMHNMCSVQGTLQNSYVIVIQFIHLRVCVPHSITAEISISQRRTFGHARALFVWLI
jgi:hypothetical protein